MKITSKAGAPRRSPSATVLPSMLGKEKSGACVPSGSIVLGVSTMVVPPSSGAKKCVREILAQRADRKSVELGACQTNLLRITAFLLAGIPRRGMMGPPVKDDRAEIIPRNGRRGLSPPRGRLFLRRGT